MSTDLVIGATCTAHSQEGPRSSWGLGLAHMTLGGWQHQLVEHLLRVQIPLWPDHSCCVDHIQLCVSSGAQPWQRLVK